MKKKIVLYTFLIIMALVFIGPMLFTVVSSFKDNTEIFSQPFSLPEVFRFENYKIAWQDANMNKYMLNSIIISLSSVLGVLIVSTLASYVLARFDFKFNKFLSIFFLLGMMVPMHTILVPISYLIGRFQLKNNVFALVLIYIAFAIPFSTIVLTRFMGNINKSVEEAAIIDGASFFQVYSRIILPMSLPAISTVSIFNFLGAWNDVLFPLIFINDDKLKPVSLELLNFSGERGADYGPMMAAIVITVAIPLIIYLLFQEKVESGMSAGSVKE
ncbi:carbohydrate ABC transporter permease [Tissierellaceae bacterium HCP3S3_D8]